MVKKRITAIDVMRGLSLLGMMLVNLTPDEELTFPALVHTEWTGISLADCFFPCFVFLCGVSAAINAEHKFYGKGWLWNAVKRGGLLIIIGMIYNHLPCIWALIFNSGYGFNEFFTDVTTYFRPFGVLQRIGFAYIFGVIIWHFLKGKRSNLIAALGLLLVTTLGFFIYQPSAPFSETSNISIWLDQALQGSNHNYVQKIFDPEGLYGNFAAIASMLLGMYAGTVLKESDHMGLVRTGVLLSLGGWFVSAFVPASKPLWTASYVLILSGCFMIILAMLDDVLNKYQGVGKWLKLPEILGAHSMLTYLVSGTVEALLNSVKVGEKNLYHFLWEGTVRMPDALSLSCLIGSLFVIAFVCAVVITVVKVKNKTQTKNA